MRYTCSVEIDLPVDQVVALWQNESHFKEWQDGFVSIQHLSGQPGKRDATARIVLEDKQRIELLETIVTCNLPAEKTATYEHVHMTNTQTSRFQELEGDRTSYVSEVEYTQFNGLMLQLIAKLFPGKFKAQSQKWMDQFKAFAEQQA